MVDLDGELVAVGDIETNTNGEDTGEGLKTHETDVVCPKTNGVGEDAPSPKPMIDGRSGTAEKEKIKKRGKNQFSMKF